jgi:hypothetical protein
MLKTASELIGYTIQATDGDIGSVTRIFFDDERWTIRYLVVDTGTWLRGRRVLISPLSVRQASWRTRTLYVTLNRDQVKNSPDIDTERPVSRQHELSYLRYYSYPPYWGGATLWGTGVVYPLLVGDRPADAPAEESPPMSDAQAADSHLRDTRVVSGYHIHATDGEIGHVEDFLLDDEVWAIRYLVIDTSNWIGGRRVLISPEWVSAVSWADSQVHVTVTRASVKTSPDYDPARLDREYERRLHAHFGKRDYWTGEAETRHGVSTTASRKRRGGR